MRNLNLKLIYSVVPRKLYHKRYPVSLGPGLLVQLLNTIDDSLVILEPQGSQPESSENTQKRNKAQALRAKRIRSDYIGVKEVSNQVPGNARNGERTKSEINNFQASGYVRAPTGPQPGFCYWGGGQNGSLGGSSLKNFKILNIGLRNFYVMFK